MQLGKLSKFLSQKKRDFWIRETPGFKLDKVYGKYHLTF
jgi:hypothetical protein